MDDSTRGALKPKPFAAPRKQPKWGWPLQALLAIGLFWCCCALSRADALLLVHGMLGDAGIWRLSGVTGALESAGWEDAGQLRVGQKVVVPNPGPSFFTLSLDSMAPLKEQSEVLRSYVEAVRRAAPGQAILIAGHSAGGVVARLLMVQHPEDGVAALITIASPHLGADTAQLGLLAGEGAFPWLDAWFGTHSFSRFKLLLKDLSPAQPDNLLGWLNRQKHPAAMYVSIVREADNVWDGGDLLVPSYSQDMNQVEALRGRTKTIRVSGGHELNHFDGELLVHIIDSMRRA